MAPGLLVKHKVSQSTIYPALGFLDTHPLISYIRLTRDKKNKFPQITQIAPIKKG